MSHFQHISTCSPQGSVLFPRLFSLYTNIWTSYCQSVKLLKFANDTILIGLISGGDESAYRREMSTDLMQWQLPWNHHLPGPKVWAKHQLTNQEGTAEDVLPASVEKNTSCQSQWRCSFTPPSFNLSSLPPSPSGTLLPLPSTKADCSVSSAALKRWLAAIPLPYKTCTPSRTLNQANKIAAWCCGQSQPTPHATRTVSFPCYVGLLNNTPSIRLLLS